MSESSAAAAPDSGNPDIPTFAELAADPDIAALLDFEPAPRKVDRPDGWTRQLQRELIARIAVTGSPGQAVDQMNKNLSGAKHLYRTEGADSFRAAWQAAVALGAERKRIARAAAPPRPLEVPGIERPRKVAPAPDRAEDQRLNEFGEWEDEQSFHRRAEEAMDSIRGKLLRARRLFLKEISGCAGKRAAFEILSEYEVDWDKAGRIEPQPDEPWAPTNQRQPDMVLTADSGWSFGDIGYGPDKMAERMAELRRELDDYHAEHGLAPIDWSAEYGLPAEVSPPIDGEGQGVG